MAAGTTQLAFGRTSSVAAAAEATTMIRSSSSPSLTIKMGTMVAPPPSSRLRPTPWTLTTLLPHNQFFRVKSNSTAINTTWRHRASTSASVRCALSPELKNTLDKVVSSNKVVLFMKGTKEFPQCGFSNTVVQILNSLEVPFESINILENEILRQALKEYSSWPTFPQLYIEGEFFGGCDITLEAYKSGELQEILEKAMCS